MKTVQIQSFFWVVFFRIRTEYGNIQTRKNSVLGNFSRIVGIALQKRYLSKFQKTYSKTPAKEISLY